MATQDATARSPDAIEGEIADTRARMDRTVAELRDRLSSRSLADAASGVVRDLADGSPNRIADAIRANPVAVALVGIGAAWIALSVGRRPPTRPVLRARRTAATADVGGLLAAIASDAEQAAPSLRRAAAALADTDAGPVLRRGADDYDGAARALRARVPAARIDAADAEDRWSQVDRANPAEPMPASLGRVEAGLDGTLALIRAALVKDLPDDLRVALGAHLHEVSTVRDRVQSMRAARG
jgi:hypothetical protein